MDITYNLGGIRKLLSDFYILTGCRIALFDRNYRELSACPSRLSNLCKLLRKNIELRNKCKHDDYCHIEECKKEKTVILYRCHAGLFEMACPLILHDNAVGFLLVGQIHGQDTNTPTFDLFQNVFKDYDVDIDALAKEFLDLTMIETEKVMAVKNLTEIFAKHICNSELIQVDTDSLAYRIDNYILENITKELTVQDFCNEFNYNKTNFYKITNKLYGVPIMQHIRHMRIHKAKLLLSSTSYKINEIAEMVGIYDFNYFTKIFKSEVECTPREFRKNNISTDDDI